jgi:hypothetical protein
MSILKLLSRHVDGQATVAELNSDLAFFNSVGADWSGRMKRLAARAPSLDIFRERFVVRDQAGWQLTSAGRAFLASIEAAELARPVVQTSVVPPVADPPANVIRLDFYRRKLAKNHARGRRRKFAPPVAAESSAT